MPKDLIVFDMDGVLVDVTESYRTTIERTVQHFTGVAVTNSQIQNYKNQGGFNDDWVLSHRLIQDAGLDVPFQDVVDYFQSIFHGDGTNGLILRERWLATNGLFDRLAARHSLAVFTGRLRWEAHVTLDRFAKNVFSEVVGVDDVTVAKPSPEGLLKIMQKVPHEKIVYIGDSVDDARASSAAKVPFIGISSPHAPEPEKLAALLKQEGAISVLPSINELEQVLGNR